MNAKHKEDSATLEILQAIENQNDVTQRHLADKLDVALGLANSYLKRCVRKGLIKVQQAPANRYLYYLTPKGFAEKTRLTAKYLSVSFDFYRSTSESISSIFTSCEQKNQNRILLCGLSELTEIAHIRSHYHQLQIIGVFDPGSDKTEFLKFPVKNDFEGFNDVDACVITSLEDGQLLFDEVDKKIESELIYTPTVLGINRE